MKEMKAKVGKINARLKLNGRDCSMAAVLFADDSVLLAKSERELLRMVDQFQCTSRKMRVNTGKSSDSV